MLEPLVIAGAVFAGIVLSGVAVGSFLQRRRRSSTVTGTSHAPIPELIRKHFHPTRLDQISVAERKFPFRVRADLQRAIDKLFDDQSKVLHFCGVRKEYSHEEIELSGCIVESQHNPAVSVPPQYEDVDVGDEEPIRCLANGLWFLEQNGQRYVVLLAPAGRFGQITGVQFQIGTVNNSEGTKLSQKFFRHLEESVLKAESYRGKILSLEQAEHAYSGESAGITVHKLRTVERDQVILPRKTLDLLDRNVIQFVKHRPGLAKFHQATKKGILFYGPPGTGKTHTIHYLSKALPGHTTLLVTAE